MSSDEELAKAFDEGVKAAYARAREWMMDTDEEDGLIDQHFMVHSPKNPYRKNT